jgi:hypothetical protein
LVEFSGKEFHNIRGGRGECREFLNHEYRITPHRAFCKGSCATSRTVTLHQGFEFFCGNIDIFVTFEF